MSVEFFIECEDEEYAGLYAVSIDGRVMSLKNGKILKQFVCKEGYLKVNFYNKTKITQRLVHRLIALAWLPNPENKTDVDHIDRNRQNNSISNLRWATRKENSLNKDYVEFSKKYCVCYSSTLERPSKWCVVWRQDDKCKWRYFLTETEAILFAKENIEGKDFLQPINKTKT